VKLCPTCGTEFADDQRFCPNDGSALRSSQQGDLVGSVIAERYHIVKKLGQGGMGAVSDAIRKSAEAFGAEIRTGARVKQIIVRGGRAVGVALEDGTVFRGISIGAKGNTTGEVVFNTAITGYQEILTDPSYCRQIVTLTYPHIGNTGTNPEDVEAQQVYAAGLVIRDLPVAHSSWRAAESLPTFLQRGKIVAIAEIDTRRLTRILREKGAQNGCLMAGAIDEAGALAQARAFPGLAGMDLAKVVTTRDGWALYFSRAPIPWPRDGGVPEARRHIGLYAYRAGGLKAISASPPCALEEVEKLEQLRALWLGFRIIVADAAEPPSPHVDTEEDLAQIRELLERAHARGER